MRGKTPAGALLLVVLCALGQGIRSPYPWVQHYDAERSIGSRIDPPAQYARVEAPAGSFAAWLRGLPLKPGRPDVRLYDGRRKWNQRAHHAVLDLDVGEKNLQQCADAVLRLRCEYLYAQARTEDLSFRFTSGDVANYGEWIRGVRPRVRGSAVTWSRGAEPGDSYEVFRGYLETLFMYAGTLSLARDVDAVADPAKLRIGDIFLEPGSPGHSVIVVDMAKRPSDGAGVFLLAQSFMPAQEMHVLRNPKDRCLSPWYPVDFGGTLKTPEWTFERSDLRRFKESQTQ